MAHLEFGPLILCFDRFSFSAIPMEECFGSVNHVIPAFYTWCRQLDFSFTLPMQIIVTP